MRFIDKKKLIDQITYLNDLKPGWQIKMTLVCKTFSSSLNIKPSLFAIDKSFKNNRFTFLTCLRNEKN